MKNLITHIVLGYPSLKYNEEMIDMMQGIGIKKIELQIPFSDPIADGHVITKACHKSLESGFKVKDAFEFAEKMTSKYPDVDFYFMTYFNIVNSYNIAPCTRTNTKVCSFGSEKFIADSEKIGIKGLVVPDIPIDYIDNDNYWSSIQKSSLSHIFVVSPTTSEKRLKIISDYTSDFIYLTQTSGTTGTRENLNEQIFEYSKTVKSIIDLPLAIGFGVSTREQIEKLSEYCDFVIVGSAVLKRVGDGESLEKVGAFLRGIVE